VSSPRSLAISLLMVLLTGGIRAADGFPFRRAVYKPWNFGAEGPWNFSEMASLGLDAFYCPADWTWEKAYPGWIERQLGSESILAAANNVTYIAGLYYL